MEINSKLRVHIGFLGVYGACRLMKDLTKVFIMLSSRGSRCNSGRTICPGSSVLDVYKGRHPPLSSSGGVPHHHPHFDQPYLSGSPSHIQPSNAAPTQLSLQSPSTMPLGDPHQDPTLKKANEELDRLEREEEQRRTEREHAEAARTRREDERRAQEAADANRARVDAGRREFLSSRV